MLLRIIDIPGGEGKESSIRVVLQVDESVSSFETESYTSPITVDFRNAQSWYYTEYPQTGTLVDEAKKVIDKTIKCGQLIGDELLGEDFQLIKLRETIEEQGYQFLDVKIESARTAFFEEYWETVILHESNYVLSAVVRSFERRYVLNSLTENSEIRYELIASKSNEDPVSKMFEQNIPASTLTKENEQVGEPLRVLYVVSRPSGCDLPFQSANSISLSLEAIARDDIVDYEIHPFIDENQFLQRLSDADNPIHVVHYDGPVILRENSIDFILANQSNLSIAKLSQVMVENKIALLSLDAREYFKNDKVVRAGKGMAEVALIAQQNGLGNVIGLEHTTNPWISGQCFDKVYQSIARGLSLGQSVVEARKALQTEVELTLMTRTPIAFHHWSQLVHYGNQDVTFFESNQLSEGPATQENSMIFQDKLFGFNSDMLPPLVNSVSDGQINLLLNQFFIVQNKKINEAGLIIGEPGSGKSHLVHSTALYLAEKCMIDYGFYFDFSKHSYTKNEMLEMIAPVLKLDPLKTKVVDEKLSSLHCCFVFDDVLGAAGQAEFDGSLQVFVKELLSLGHIVMMTGATELVPPSLNSFILNMEPLLLEEQKILATNWLAQYQPEFLSKEAGQDKDWDGLLVSLRGHPWLTQKIASLLEDNNISVLEDQVSKYIDINNEQKILQFYSWQWSNLSLALQNLLFLCVESRGLLLEMLMVASEQPQQAELTHSFFSLLGEPELKFSDAINSLESGGFLKRFPHGRFVDDRCLDFIQSQFLLKASEEQPVANTQLGVSFSQIVCEGICILTQHLHKQPNPSISNNLLFNRRSWVKHFERLWFNHDFNGFMRVKNCFEQFLAQVKLGAESKAWCMDLLQRTPVVAANHTDETAKLAWLALANSVLNDPQASEIKQITQGFEVWINWFDSLSNNVEEKQLPLFQQVVSLLENYSIVKSNWGSCLRFSEKSAMVYRQYEAWPRVIQALKSQARYHYEMGNKKQALVVENQIMNEIPYAEAPTGFQSQQQLDIVLARLSRADSDSAQVILDQLKLSDSATGMSDMLEGLQSDIHYQKEDYSAALPYYCKVWERALQADLKPQIEQLLPRMMEFEDKLGPDNFNKLFEQIVTVGTRKPRDCLATLH